MRRAAGYLLLGLLACDGSEQRRPHRASPDSRTLYGDPALVPTPEGERARRDLARAGDLESLLPLEEPQVVVGHPKDMREQVLVRGRVRTDADETKLRERIETSVRAIFGPETELVLHLETKAELPHERPPLDPLLWLAFMGLGASAGIALERERRSRRRV
jgi:hypothetical protein